MILESIESNYTWGLILILFLNLSQRKIPNSNKKRIATIWICSLMLLMEIGMVTIISQGMEPLHRLGRSWPVRPDRRHLPTPCLAVPPALRPMPRQAGLEPHHRP
ncbi:MAG: hypothetical protein LKE39_03970 [Sphaerochaeta sp.]|jgi:hypothetical protein|nr:hypothetical protein [Sphaerochaeta sp.]